MSRQPSLHALRTRWSAIGAAIAIGLGGGGIGIGYASTSSGERPIYRPINPCRLADIRPAPDTVGSRTTPLGPDETYTLSGWDAVGNCTLPTGTAGLALNVTAVAATQATYLTLFPGGAPLPTTSNLNPTPGQPPTPNAVNVDLGPTGAFNVFNKYGNVYVIVDVVGYYDDHDHDDRYYRTGQVDAALGAKANKADVYTKTEVDSRVAAVITGHIDGDAVLELGQHSTQSLGYVVVPNASTTVDTLEDGRLLVTFSAQSRCMDNGPEPHTSWCLVRVLVDGSPIWPTRVIWAKGNPDTNDWFSHSQQFVSAVLAAGPHTVQAEYRVDEATGMFDLDQIVLSAVPLAP